MLVSFTSMGIKGLLQFLKEQQEIVSLQSFRGCTAAVDVYCWLHKAVYGCVEQIAIAGNDQGQYIAYCERYWNTLKRFGIKPILVFDGQNLPAKSHTEKERRERRKANRDKANALLAEGKKSEARQYFERCIDITPQMAHKVIVAAVSQGIDCIVAPYEADAELAFLSLSGIAQLIISEDSDLLCFGCERDYSSVSNNNGYRISGCDDQSQVMFKMDLNGDGILQERSRILEHKSFRKRFTMDHFVKMCILSGCDYVPSLPGIGLAKATKYMSQSYNCTDIPSLLRRLPLSIKLPSGAITDEYIRQFTTAVMTFKHQVVFNPQTRKRQPLTPNMATCCGIQDHPDDMSFAGRFFPADQAMQMALGNIDLRTMDTLLPRIDPDLLLSRENGKLSIWHPEYKPKGQWSKGDNPTSVDRSAHSTKQTCVLIPTDRIVRKRRLSQTESPETTETSISAAGDSNLLSGSAERYPGDGFSTVEVIEKVVPPTASADDLPYSADDIEIPEGPAAPPIPTPGGLFNDRLRSIYHEGQEEVTHPVHVKSRFFSTSTEHKKSDTESPIDSQSQSQSPSQSQSRSQPSTPVYKSKLLKVLDDMEKNPSPQSRVFRWSKSSLHNGESAVSSPASNQQFKSPLLKSRLVQQIQHQPSSYDDDVAEAMPSVSFSASRNPFKRTLKETTTLISSSSDAQTSKVVNPFSSRSTRESSPPPTDVVTNNPFRKDRTVPPVSSVGSVLGRPVDQVTSSDSSTSKGDNFSVSPLRRIGKPAFSQEKFSVTQKLTKFKVRTLSSPSKVKVKSTEDGDSGVCVDLSTGGSSRCTDETSESAEDINGVHSSSNVTPPYPSNHQSDVPQSTNLTPASSVNQKAGPSNHLKNFISIMSKVKPADDNTASGPTLSIPSEGRDVTMGGQLGGTESNKSHNNENKKRGSISSFLAQFQNKKSIKMAASREPLRTTPPSNSIGVIDLT